MYENLSVLFSGHNIKWFAVLAIESFLQHYPYMRDRIVYFDDESIDDTKEELESRKIKVITWRACDKDEYALLRTKIKTLLPILPVRVSIIMKSSFEQIQSKYVFVSDGDVVYKKGGFLEKYIDGIKSGNKIVSSKGHTFFNANAFSEISKFQSAKSYMTYIRKATINDYILYTNNKEEIEKYLLENPYTTDRILFFQCLIDLEYMKSINLIGDIFTDETFEYYDTILDTGTIFHFELYKNEVPFIWVPSDYIQTYIHHWCWLSSGNRDTSEFLHRSTRDIEEMIKYTLYTSEFKEILNQLDIHPLRLVRDYGKFKGKSNLI